MHKRLIIPLALIALALLPCESDAKPAQTNTPQQSDIQDKTNEQTSTKPKHTTPTPPQLLSELRATLTEVGSARFSVLFWDVYDSSLLTPSGTYDNSSKYLLEITYLRNIKSAVLIERTEEQWQHLGVDAIQYQNYLPQLKALWPDIKKGDRLSLWVDSNNASFYFNNLLSGSIDDGVFGNLFASIWLSPDTSEPKLRKKLIGQSNEK
ncbi:MAG: chalcone isomerase family protein [Thalassotalea sp.]|nr:chalcone isomerase family protein [Thalassotalea sp.]